MSGLNVREELLSDLEEFLRSGGHEVVRVDRACFDLLVITRDGRSFIVKVLTNVDGLRKEVAEDLKVISHFLEAVPVIVALRRRSGPLERGVVYHRYEIPVMEPITFAKTIEGEPPRAVADRGGKYVEVREEEVESVRVSSVRRRQLKLEGGRVSLARAEEAEIEGVPVRFRVPERVDTGKDRMTRFERRVAKHLERMGAERTGKVRRAPFELLAKDGDTVLVQSEDVSSRESMALRDVVQVTGSIGFVVTRKRRKRASCLPTIDLETLEDLKDIEDLKEYLEEHDPSEKIRELVEEAGVTSPKEIARRTGLSESVIRELLRRMTAEGDQKF